MKIFSAPLNIFEPRYIQMIDDSMKSDRIIGMIQPKKSGDTKKPDLFKIGCMGKITSFNETDDGRYIVILNGLIRFKIINEIESDKSYRMCEVDHKDFEQDLSEKKEPIKFSDLRLIFDNLRSLFEKQGYLINWKEKRGYKAVQLGFGKIKNSKISKAMKGYFTKKNLINGCMFNKY